MKNKGQLEHHRIEDFYDKFGVDRIEISDAVKEMRRISRLTQPEFAQRRKIALSTLRQIETGKGDPKLSTLNNLISIFGLKVGLVKIDKNK